MVYLICDDKVKEIALFKEDLNKYINHNDEVIVFSDVNLMLEHMSKKRIDILFLDIILGKASGIDAAVELNKISPWTQIVFISSYASDFVEDVYIAEHIGFLRKPVSAEKLELVLTKAQNRLLNSCIAIEVGHKTVLVEPAQISYIEAKSHESTLFYCNGKVVLVKLSLSELEILLPNNFFFRCHRSFIVNIKQIKHYTNTIISVNGYELPIPTGRKYKKHTIERFSKYWAKSILL